MMEYIRDTRKVGKVPFAEYICPVCRKVVEIRKCNAKKTKQCAPCYHASKKGEGNPNYRHGGCLNDKRLYYVWGDMIARTSNINHKRATDYILRGIGCCDEWKDFSVFRAWAVENGYAHGLTLDRIDNNCGYSPENCRLVTNQENIRNSRKVKICVGVASDIKRMLGSGKSMEEVSKKLGCSLYIVEDIARGRTWRDA